MRPKSRAETHCPWEKPFGRLHREGKSLRDIAADMRDRGFKISHVTVKEILSREEIQKKIVK
jgi:hypothetical protein